MADDAKEEDTQRVSHNAHRRQRSNWLIGIWVLMKAAPGSAETSHWTGGFQDPPPPPPRGNSRELRIAAQPLPSFCVAMVGEKIAAAAAFT